MNSHETVHKNKVKPLLVLAEHRLINSFIDYTPLPSNSCRQIADNQKRPQSVMENYFNSVDLNTLVNMKLDQQTQKNSKKKLLNGREME